jgi:hypothetical protein
MGSGCDELGEESTGFDKRWNVHAISRMVAEDVDEERGFVEKAAV